MQSLEKPKPVLNYKSRMNVPVSFQNKPSPENYEDGDKPENSEKDSGDSEKYNLGNGNFQHSENQSSTSPQRKCWDTEAINHSEPCVAVSESNYHIFDKNDEKVVENSETQMNTSENSRKLEDEIAKGESTTYNQNSFGSPDHAHDAVYFESQAVKQSPRESDDANLNSSPDEIACGTPKKGLALFIGQENTISNNDVSVLNP